MPIYEYVCADCDSAFEEIVFGEEAVRCKRCESARVEKQLSAFAVGAQAAAAQPAPGCGSCGAPEQGMCGRMRS